MDDYIPRREAIAAVCRARLPDVTDGGIPIANGKRSVTDCVRRLKEIPAADVRPVVRAVWRRYSPFTDTYECSNCGEQVIDQQFRTNFCPNCGADMREES